MSLRAYHQDFWNGVNNYATGARTVHQLDSFYRDTLHVSLHPRDGQSVADSKRIETVLAHADVIRDAASLIQSNMIHPGSGLPTYTSYQRAKDRISGDRNVDVVAVAEADLRNFKSFNDSRGNTNGDRAIALHGLLLEQVRQVLHLDNVSLFQPVRGDEIRAVAVSLSPRTRSESLELSRHPELCDPNLALQKLFEGYYLWKSHFEGRLRVAADAHGRGDDSKLRDLRFIQGNLSKAELEADLKGHPLVKIHIAAGLSSNCTNLDDAIKQAEVMEGVAKLLGRGHVSLKELSGMDSVELGKLLKLANLAEGRVEGQGAKVFSREDALRDLLPQIDDFNRYSKRFPGLRISLPSHLEGHRSSLMRK